MDGRDALTGRYSTGRVMAPPRAVDHATIERRICHRLEPPNLTLYEMVIFVDPKQLRPLYGRRCRALIHCHACGQSHMLSGTLQPGQRAGDIALEGQIYASSDVERVSLEGPEILQRGRTHPAFQWILLAGAVLMWLQALSMR